MLDDFVSAAEQQLTSATSVVLLVDADVARFGAADRVRELANKIGASIAVMGTAKGAIDETDPNYIGVYGGASPNRASRR